MSNIATITKRELSAYFTSPVAYVFIVIFLPLTSFFPFQLDGFFEMNAASLDSFFRWHPWLYMFLVPAVGMRLWSEERHQGTLELLMTLPVSPWQAILGKFLASWIFLGIALVLTFPMVWTVNYLGDPDNGIIWSAYFGSFMMAGACLAITCMTSSLTRNQVIAFIISLVICFLMILAGFEPVTAMIRNTFPDSIWLVDLISSVSTMTHFMDFQRGVIDLRHLLFFGSVIAFSLFCTSVALKSIRS